MGAETTMDETFMAFADGLEESEARRAFEEAIEAGERAHVLTIGPPARLAWRVAMGRLDGRGEFHSWQPSAFLIWRGCRYSIRELRIRAREAFWRGLADRLPRELAYFATIRLAAWATTGPYGSQVVPELTLMDALKRWED